MLRRLVPARRLRGLTAVQRNVFRYQSTQPQHSTDLIYNFNKRTLLPTPRPYDDISDEHSSIYTTTDNQELFAILEACLSSPFLLERAQGVFQNLREKQIENFTSNNYSTLDVTIYNKFIERYFQEADKRSKSSGDKYIGEAFKLWDALFTGKEGVNWELETWTLMVKGMAKHGDSSYSCKPLLDAVNDLPGKPSLRDVIIKYSHFTSLSESFAAVSVLTRAAASAGNVPLIEELASIHAELEKSMNGVEQENASLPDEAASEAVQGEDIMGVLSPSTSETPYNLYSLRQSLKPLGHTSKTLAGDPAARQRLLEESAYETAKARFEHEMNELEKAGVSTALSGHPLQKLMWDWWKKVSVDIQAKLQKSMETTNPKTKEEKFMNEITPFLSLLSSEKMSLITVLEILRLSGTGGIAEGMKTTRALLSVGKAVENEHHAEILKQKHGISLKGVEADAKQVKRKLRYFDHRKAEKELDLKSPEFTGLIDDAMGTSEQLPEAHSHDIASERAKARVVEERMNKAWTPNWSQIIRIKVGSFLVDSLMECATITRTAKHPESGEEMTEAQPAFSQSYQYVRGKKLGVIKVNTAVADRLDKDPLGSTIHPRHLPMLVKPKPWLRYDSGGYLFHKNSAMRFKDSNEQQSYILKASSEGTMEPVLAGLDVLGATPWNINRKVFNVVKEAWNTGEGLAKIPPATTKTPDPVKPANYAIDPKERSNYLQSMKAVVNERRNNHSIRCDTNYKLEIARAFLNETFYFPHTLDFRGRAYPIPPHLNHIGDDLSRGLLIFAEKRPLGEKGMRWLKIHLANVYGYDKASFNEREQFADEHMEEIYDSADNPLNGRKWWLKADDPWQCLAACYEIQAAMLSPNPLAYESALPVHQDGTCNGLQHYAALGGDPMGAKQVNLEQGDRPSDVYTAVADLVIEDIKKDALESDNEFAKILEGKITRKVVKQTVMTTVYGVTFIGARDQIDKQLQDRGDIPQDKVYTTASYLAKKVLRSIGDLFAGANAIQKWLSMSARYIAKSIPPERLIRALEPLEAKRKNSPANKGNVSTRTAKEQMTSVIWTTPLGLPIVQPYRKAKKKQVATLLQSVYLADPNIPTEVNPIKQASAFPPNFIHSLDATHMVLTALQCSQIGITYASVHDSYWTHASTVDHMSEIIRDTFVKLHCEEILKRLRDEVIERYKGYRIPISSLGAKIDKENPKIAPLLPKRSKKVAQKEAEREEEEEEEESEDLMNITSEDLEAIETIKAKTNDDLNLITKDDEISDFIKSKYIKLEDVLPDLPKKGPFDVRGVVNSPYFFS
ncbi:DNA/RNA polymerase [Wallemia mellicola]|uniref:DNA-directed RNA polymerase n=1 Tax=Wallemia mellicola TaxID=1708541 RepID=A0A4T0PG05_9BASI|nr:DNA/RNA polymerase [Wallemia mellicola]TIC28167.1 DNA/RNA polymerase [Wallemia mellicola]